MTNTEKVKQLLLELNISGFDNVIRIGKILYIVEEMEKELNQIKGE